MALDTRVKSLGALNDVGDWVQVSPGTTGIVGYCLRGTADLTVTWQGTLDQTNVFSILGVPSDSTTAATTTAISGSSQVVGVRVDAGGYLWVRPKVTTYTSGSIIADANPQQG